MSVTRIGILTGGGDCPGLNAVIRAVVKRARADFGWAVTGIEDGFAGLMGPELAVRDLDASDVVGILPKGGTILGTSNRANPYADAEGRDRSAEVAARLRDLGVDALVVVGGDGTQSIGHRLFVDHGVPVIGIPKTIDNDVPATDATFGFDSARAIATAAVDNLHSTAESHERVMLLEVMGRNAGFIALHAGLAGGADVILLPEIPYDIQAVLEKLQARVRRGRRFSIVVVAEGARPRGGEQVITETAEEMPGRNVVRLGGIAHRVSHELAGVCETETRVTILGHLQRGGSPTPFDRILGTRFGCAALDLIADERFDRMVALKGGDVVDVPLAEAVGRVRLVDPAGQMVTCARALGISFG